MKILITGAAGFVASHLIEYLNKFKSNFEIIGIDNFSYGYRERLIGLNINFLEADIQNIDQLEINNIDAVIHTAAIAPLPDNEVNPVLSYEQNVLNTVKLIDFISRRGCNKFIFLSTGALYENDINFPSKERDHIYTSLVYPTTKMCAEHALRAYSETYGISTYALRLFNMYGPRQDFFRKQPPLIGYLLKCLFNNETPQLYSDGEQSRDYVYINDLAEIVIELLSSKYNKKTLTALNIGSGVSTSVNEIINYLGLIHGRKINVERNPSDLFWQKYPSLFNRKNPLNKNIIQKEVNKYSLADISKVTELTGIKCNTEMHQGLKKCYDYAKEFFEK